MGSISRPLVWGGLSDTELQASGLSEPLSTKEQTQQFGMQILYLTKNYLDLAQFLGDILYALGSSCLTTIFVFEPQSTPNSNARYGWVTGSGLIILTPKGAEGSGTNVSHSGAPRL